MCWSQMSAQCMFSRRNKLRADQNLHHSLRFQHVAMCMPYAVIPTVR